MSRRFLLATIFLLLVFIGGFMTANGTHFIDGVIIVIGLLGVLGSMLLLNKPWWNKKLF